ncbi:arginase family protein [Candidatus Pacearchaeota archaeon]|nr:arginase family protein [Candidatus Pacearchaeota archaeon]
MFIVKVPGINGLRKTNGCKEAGNAIIGELKNFSLSEFGKNINFDSLDFEEIHLDNSDLKHSDNLIHKNCMKIFETKPKTVFLGGDHSVSYSILKAFSEYCDNENKKPCLIIFDACVDLAENSEVPNNNNWLKELIDIGFPAENVLIVGARSISYEEKELVKSKGIKLIQMSTLFEDIKGICDTIMEFSRGKELYISIDISVVDPAFAPSTIHSETGGLSSREFIYLIQRLNKVKNLKAADIVEINSEDDNKRDNLTVKLGAKILSELI